MAQENQVSIGNEKGKSKGPFGSSPKQLDLSRDGEGVVIK